MQLNDENTFLDLFFFGLVYRVSGKKFTQEMLNKICIFIVRL